MYDNTYKTNNKNFAFFNVISLNYFNKYFNFRFSFINNENSNNFK